VLISIGIWDHWAEENGGVRDGRGIQWRDETSVWDVSSALRLEEALAYSLKFRLRRDWRGLHEDCPSAAPVNRDHVAYQKD
jgi:hypothetical protein